VGVATDGRTLIQAAGELQPDVIVTDVAMPFLNGIDAAREIHKQNPKPKIIFLTMHPELAYASAAIAAGASGYVLKSAAGEELIRAIHDAFKGHRYVSKAIAKPLRHAGEIATAKGRGAVGGLTHRQREVLQLLAEGRQAKEIATILNISSRTAEFHKYQVMKLLGIRTLAELTRYALRHGMVE